jgi:rhodanese-related sulfurtransferase
MTSVGKHGLLIAAAFAFSACAEPVKPSATPAHSDQKTEYQKPVRINARGEVSSISLEEFFQLHQSGKALVFDARPSFIYSFGHVPGAINLPKNQCDAEIPKRESEIKSALAAGKTIVVYCTSATCPDAQTVAMHISGFGHPASVFSGGWDAWKDAGMPVE